MHRGQAPYEPDSIDSNWPVETPPAAQDGGFESYQERIDGNKIRARSGSRLTITSRKRDFTTKAWHHMNKNTW